MDGWGPLLTLLTNDAWLLQKGTGRTLLPLTDKSHQRSMTYLTTLAKEELLELLKRVWPHVMGYSLKHKRDHAKSMPANTKRFQWKVSWTVCSNLDFISMKKIRVPPRKILLFSVIFCPLTNSADQNKRCFYHHNQFGWCGLFSHHDWHP